MKVKILFVILLLSSLLLSSCQYDQTDDFRANFTQKQSYFGQLQINEAVFSVCVTTLDETTLSLRFLDGPLCGLEKRFSEDGEVNLYEGMKFSLSNTTDYFALYRSFLFLSKQDYHCNSLKEDQLFSFNEDQCRIDTVIDPLTDKVKRISVYTDQKQLTFNITE